MKNKTSKRQLLYAWLAKQPDWVYLRDVPKELFGMERADVSTALADFCKQGRCDFRVLGLKQYRVKP